MNLLDTGHVPESMAALPGRVHILEDRPPKEWARPRSDKQIALARRREAEAERRAQGGEWYRKKLERDRERYWRKKGKK